MRIIIFILLLAQTSLAQKVLNPQEYFNLILLNHPIAKQAALLPEMGNATILKARGSFDPKVFQETSQKYYNSSQYFSLLNSGLKIPTWYGLEVKAGLQEGRGANLDAQWDTPENGLAYAGASLTLGKGLLIDQRRADLRKAKLYQTLTIAEQRLQLNNLLLESGKAYWDWFYYANAEKIMEEALAVADQRLQAVKRTVELGDRAGIDTVEASIQVQNRKSMYEQFRLERKNAQLVVSSFLWNENLVPLELSDSLVSLAHESLLVNNTSSSERTWKDSSLLNHPYLQVSALKIEQLKVDRQLKREYLKPELNLHYNLLSEPINQNPAANLSIENYKWGLEFSMPLLLRKERGDLKLSNLKLQEAELGYEQNKVQIGMKINASLNEWENSALQSKIMAQMALDSKQLLEAERTMFDNGESSLFLINAREVAYLQAVIKKIETQAKNQKSVLETYFYMNRFVR
jgi:outer membrane protein TolC